MNKHNLSHHRFWLQFMALSSQAYFNSIQYKKFAGKIPPNASSSPCSVSLPEWNSVVKGNLHSRLMSSQDMRMTMVS